MGVGRRIVAAVPFVAATWTASLGNARASDDAACVEAHQRGRDLRRQDALTEAREAWRACSAEACPAIVREECILGAREIDAEIPTIVVRATRPSGDDAQDATVAVDGVRRLDRLDGRPLELDPGPRVVVVESPGMRPERRTLTLVAGEKLRVVAIRLEPVAEASPEPSAWPPPAAWVLGAVAVTGVTVGAVFGIRGLGKESDLDACAPGCTEEAYDDMFVDYVVADVSFGVAIVAAGAAIGITLLDADSADAPGSASIALRPAVRGAGVLVDTTF